MNQPLGYSSTSELKRSPFSSPRDFVSLLFRRKAIALMTFGLVLAAAILGAMRQRAFYVAQTDVLVDRGATLAEGPHSRPHMHWWEEMKTLMATARTHEVAEIAAQLLAQRQTERMAGSPEFANATVGPPSAKSLQERFSVEVIDETNVIRMAFRGDSAQETIDGVNAFAEAFLRRSREFVRDSSPPAEIYTDLIAEKRKSLKEIDANINAIKAGSRIADINTEAVELTRQRTALSNLLSVKRAESQAVQSELAAITRSLKERPEVLIPNEEFKRDPSLQLYERRLAELRGRLNTLLATYTRENPQVQALERDVEACRVSIRGQVNDMIVAKRNAVAGLRGEIASFEKSLAETDTRLGELSELDHELELLELDRKSHLQDMASFEGKARDTELNASSDPRAGKLHVLSVARDATRVGGGAKQKMLLLVATVLALGLAFAAAYGADMLDRSIRFPEEAEAALGVPILATIRKVDAAHIKAADRAA